MTKLRDEVLTLLIAGLETTANVLAWTFYLLAQRPDAEQRMYDEAKAVLGGPDSLLGRWLVGQDYGTPDRQRERLYDCLLHSSLQGRCRAANLPDPLTQ